MHITKILIVALLLTVLPTSFGKDTLLEPLNNEEMDVLIKAADVLHNMQSLLYDHEAAEDPESVWLPFNAGPDLQLWYFQGVLGAVEERLGDHPLARDLRSSVDRLQVCIE